jgi:hypothetical protein
MRHKTRLDHTTAMESESQPGPRRERKPIFGGISLLLFFLTLGGCAALDLCITEKTGPDNLGHLDDYLMIGALGCTLSFIFGLVGLLRRECPRWPAFFGLVVNLLPMIGVVRVVIHLIQYKTIA